MTGSNYGVRGRGRYRSGGKNEVGGKSGAGVRVTSRKFVIQEGKGGNIRRKITPDEDNEG